MCQLRNLFDTGINFFIFLVVTSDDEHVVKPKRLRKKRRKKEDEMEEDIIDGFSIRCFKSYSQLQQFKFSENILTSDDVAPGKDESTETSSLNAHEESYVNIITILFLFLVLLLFCFVGQLHEQFFWWVFGKC